MNTVTPIFLLSLKNFQRAFHTNAIKNQGAEKMTEIESFLNNPNVTLSFKYNTHYDKPFFDCYLQSNEGGTYSSQQRFEVRLSNDQKHWVVSIRYKDLSFLVKVVEFLPKKDLKKGDLVVFNSPTHGEVSTEILSNKNAKGLFKVKNLNTEDVWVSPKRLSIQTYDFLVLKASNRYGQELEELLTEKFGYHLAGVKRVKVPHKTEVIFQWNNVPYYMKAAILKAVTVQYPQVVIDFEH